MSWHYCYFEPVACCFSVPLCLVYILHSISKIEPCCVLQSLPVSSKWVTPSPGLCADAFHIPAELLAWGWVRLLDIQSILGNGMT